MQVDWANFPAIFDHFVELLRSCDFYAIDEEMSGITTADHVETILHSPDECYAAKRAAARTYSIIQVGICLFHRDRSSATLRYDARPFTFIIFPSGDGVEAGEESSEVVGMSASALAFLRRHHMSFDAWIYDGIATCNAEREARLRENLAAPATTTPTALLTDAERTWVEEGVRTAVALQQRVSEDAPGGCEMLLPTPPSRLARDELKTTLVSAAERVRVLYRRSTNTVSLHAQSSAEFERVRQTEAHHATRRVMDVLGFRLVYAELMKSRKPCVGHNCFADLLFLMQHFGNDLPERAGPWKTAAHAAFPLIFDTRYIATRADLFAPGRFTTFHLQGLYDHYGSHTRLAEIHLPLGFAAYHPLTLMGKKLRKGFATAAHEAGYDALMTGSLLIHLLAELGCAELHEAPASIHNKVALFRSLYAVDVGSAGDEYLPGAVLDLAHTRPLVSSSQVESCLQRAELTDAVLHPVTTERTLAVMPRRATPAAVDAEALAARLNLISSSIFTASVYAQPHPHSTTSAPFFSCPTGMATTPLRLMRRLVLRR